MTAIDYPPMQDPASFNLDAVKKQIEAMIKQPRRRNRSDMTPGGRLARAARLSPISSSFHRGTRESSHIRRPSSRRTQLI